MGKFKQGLNRILRLLIFPFWMALLCFQYIFTGAPLSVVYVNIGSLLIKLGAGISIGQPVHIPSPRGTKRLAYVRNIYYNAAQNRVTADYSDKPIPGYTKGQKLKKPKKKFTFKNIFKR